MAEGNGIDLFKTRLAKKMGTKSGQVGFDPFSILTVLLSLFADCIKPKAATLRRRAGRHAMVATRVCAATGCDWAEGMEVARHLDELANEAKDPELQSFIDDCWSGGGQ